MARSTTNADTAKTPRWLHWWSIATVVFALPLLTLGAEVTTKDVGMVDRAPIRSPLHLLQVIEESGGIQKVVDEKGIGWLIEHSHRFFGWLVGILVIVLAVGLWRCEKRGWLGWVGIAALLAVGLQGVLGMLRVDLEQRLGPEMGRNVALFHGCTAQLVFALLTGIAVWTSPAWHSMADETVTDDASSRRAALALVGLMYVQIVFGAIMRHKAAALGVRLHILLAFATVAAAGWLWAVVLRKHAAGTPGRKAVGILWGLLALQLVLGMETLLSKFAVSWSYTLERVEPVSLAPDLVRSIHVIVGALTFSTAVSIVLLTHRHAQWITRTHVVPVRQLEGAL
jgi:cytochrome c oxidase assembly protein subunit 15